ncbi:intraflagellar transport protein 80 homolog isoform X2 [Neodiprion pinetum]|uniref:intraflagellar transport protein 80 homolog isoform X2 n=1 Tax=Neodiprion pinetum TaxID=441929 RepID=UPI001EDD2C6F|nr:intraflagellar transport protein 80 homolog [Neodiprion pinetum]XP_046470778.1 intraflagellar transport protein 80 homolog [Neodiprion pinetum]XP_046470779.1 intraflagellar transport protein 80 homolog [Neodiprion pinetum]XP_046470780.1 intraflagellar transport protein 80 homolog [Neodiprion pinetum]XP_046470782.1 intraflagellar transport protein 80 homolog [Neodiprion pinetum]
MRFKISLRNTNGHKGLVTCVAWNSTEEIYSCGEDHILLCWRLEGGTVHSSIITTFPSEFCPTDMQWHPRPMQPSMSSKKQSFDILLITTADGKFHLINKNGRIEKSVEAHKGATLVGQWNNDGSALMTTGEDGLVKVWSRSGMLRSTVARGRQPALSAAWSPDCSSILYALGAHLLVQFFNTNAKPHKWHGHDGLILAVAWSHKHGLIVSAGEDCRYKVWDSTGNQLYCSSVTEHPIVSLSWCASGDYFAVGSFNTVRLCDKTGWSHALEKVNTGSIYSIAWSSDSTQVAMACGGGGVLTAHVIDRRLEWSNYEATLVRRKTIEVREVGSERHETLEISDRVVKMEFGFGHLVVITPSQCHVYATINWNTPAIFDLKNGSVSSVILAEKHFLLVEWNVTTLYSYQGRLLGIPRWKGMTQEPIHTSCIALCSDTLVIRDQSNNKLLHVLEVSSNKPIMEGQPHTHLQGVSQLALNHVGSVTERQLAVIDVNRDLFLISIRTSGFGRVCKIAVMAQNIQWATDANILVAMLDVTLSVWLCPSCVHYSDKKMIRKTRIDKNNSEFGKQPDIVCVQGGLVTVRRGDGALVTSAFYTFFTSLHQHIINNRWQDALSLCRIAQNEILWTSMAVMATDAKELSAAEEAYAAIGRFDKVDYIQYIKLLPNKIEKLAGMTLLAGDLLAAEGILLQNGLVVEAIHANIKIYNWNRALELATRHKKELDTVLQARKKYLRILNKQETNQLYLSLTVNTLNEQEVHLMSEPTEEPEKLDNESEKLNFLEL